MGTFEFLMFIVIAVCVVLVLVILSQNPKGGGLSSSFGGGGSQMFGVQRTNEFLDKATWALASGIVVLVIVSTMIKDNPKAQSDGIGDVAPAPIEETLPATNEGNDSSVPTTPAPVPQGNAPTE